MKSPYFSVIIPTRIINDCIIHETLPALNEQSYREFEVFIVPDNESEVDLVLQKKYPWLTILPSYKMKKPGDKRDYAVSKARGEIMSFLDDDAYPSKHWLYEASHIFQKRTDIAALGGPGVLPTKNINKWERVFDAVLKTRFGSGGYEYRFTPMSERFVDDYPAMNLMMRKSVFKKIGGFSNQYWPGEDSKLLSRLDSQYTEKIFYHPAVKVFHHRRNTLEGHLKQHIFYGLTRGTFFAHGDVNSRSPIYIVPAIFVSYLFFLFIFTLLFPFFPLHKSWLLVMLIPIFMYISLMAYVMTRTYFITQKTYIALGTSLVIPLMHITYGIFFVYGFGKEKLKKLFV